MNKGKQLSVILSASHLTWLLCVNAQWRDIISAEAQRRVAGGKTKGKAAVLPTFLCVGERGEQEEKPTCVMMFVGADVSDLSASPGIDSVCLGLVSLEGQFALLPFSTSRRRKNTPPDIQMCTKTRSVVLK